SLILLFSVALGHGDRVQSPCQYRGLEGRGYDVMCRSLACMLQEAGKSRRKIPGWCLPALGYTLSAASLIWVFRGFNLHQTLADFATLDWRYVSIAVIFDLSVYLAHGWRWNILLRPVARPSYWRSVQAIYIGLYANEVLPLRTGELIRCYLMAHWNDMPVSLALA